MHRETFESQYQDDWEIINGFFGVCESHMLLVRLVPKYYFKSNHFEIPIICSPWACLPMLLQLVNVLLLIGFK